jgi:hypothetical protein
MFGDVFDWFNSGQLLRGEILGIDWIRERFERIEGLKDSFCKLLQEFDPMIKGLEWRRSVNAEGLEVISPFSVRNEYQLHFSQESEGTQKLFKLYSHFYVALNLVRLNLIFDELDASLHPAMLRRIVQMFNNKEINKMGSQLIFTSHNLILLDNKELRRDQIWFTEKDDRGMTRAYGLDSFKMRSDLDYLKNYLAGRFGAVPFANREVHGDGH